MALPTFRSLAARRHGSKSNSANGSASTSTGADGRVSSSEKTLTPPAAGVDISRATRNRRNAVIAASVFFFVSIVFLILTLIGNISNRPVLRSTYFFTLNLTNIIPASAGDIILVNSLARSLGLHDFYQVGLWSFCEGYNDEGITHCSSPRTLYWFNPVQILLNELLAGATIALPANINSILKLIKLASHIMFAFFLTGTCMTPFSILASPLALRSRWWSGALAIWTFIGALLTAAAAVIATVMFIIFKNVITSQKSLNIGAAIGTQMFVFMWIAAACNVLGFALHLGLVCCCASRRDVRTGRRRGAKAAYSGGGVLAGEKGAGKKGGRGWFGRGKRRGEVV